MRIINIVISVLYSEQSTQPRALRQLGGPDNGAIDNNDTCYDEAGTFIIGCEVFYVK